MKTKNYFLSLLLATMMCAPFTASAQVTIGSVEPPQATLDIRGAEGETGQAFRLIDGNQADGRVLTVVGDDGVATWMPPAGGVRRLINNPTPAPPPFNLLAPMNTMSMTNVVIIDHEAYTFVLEPGFWRIDFNFGVRVENFTTLMPSLNSSIELIVCITPLSSSDAGADIFDNVLSSIPGRDHTFVRITPATQSLTVDNRGDGRIIGSLIVDTRGLPTQKYRFAIGRSTVRNATDDVNIQFLIPTMHRSAFATFVPELP